MAKAMAYWGSSKSQGSQRMNADQPSQTAGPNAGSPAPARGKAERYVKLGFLVVVLAVVGWLIARQYLGTSLTGWSGDLNAALQQAARENRRIVALTYDSPNDLEYEKMRENVAKLGNAKALEEAGVIKVHTRLAMSDPLAVKYKVSRFPATLLIAPDGTLITCWTGYIGEVAFRKEFLMGEQQK